MSVQHVYIQAGLHVHVHDAYPCPRCMSMSTLDIHFPICMNILYGHGHMNIDILK
jgi:hypothetical protein